MKMAWHQKTITAGFNTKIGRWISPRLINAPEPSPISFGIGIVFVFIVGLVAALIGSNLIGSVATTVGGALKNGNLTGAAKDLTGNITLVFVVVVILGIVAFLAVIGFMAAQAAEGKAS